MQILVVILGCYFECGIEHDTTHPKCFNLHFVVLIDLSASALVSENIEDGYRKLKI